MKTRQLLSEVEKKEKEIEEFQAWLANIKHYAFDLQTFLAAKQMECDLSEQDNFVQSIIKSEKLNHPQISLKNETILQSITTEIKSFGEIIVEYAPNKLIISRQKDQQAQQMIAAPVPMSIDNLTLTLRQTVTTHGTNVRGCTILPDGRMMFTCYNQQKVTAIHKNGTKDFEMKLDSCFDIGYIDNNIIMVTSGDIFPNIVLIDTEKRKVCRKLHVGDYNEGAELTNDGTLIYSAGVHGLKSIELNKETKGSIRSGPLGISGYSYVTSFDKHIIYTNPDNDTVTCINSQGTTQWTFKKETILKLPQGISVDKNGNIYVAGAHSNNIVVISHDGKRHRQILSSAEGLTNLQSLHYDQSSNTFCWQTDRVARFCLM